MGDLAPAPGPESLSSLASQLLRECSLLDKLSDSLSVECSLAAGKSHAFWSEGHTQLAAARDKAIAKLEELTALIRGPHDIIHEFVAPNWDHGALYVFLRNGVLEALVSGGGERVPLSKLSKCSNIPEDKLLRILGLLKCKQFVSEPEKNMFAMTAVSETLIQEPDFRSWVEFQLFETRVASAHLSDALAAKPNDYESGSSGFVKGWGMEMYDWHAQHPEMGDRFRRAMKGVSAGLDPADALLEEWLLTNSRTNTPIKIVELGGRYGFASVSLAKNHTYTDFEVRSDCKDFLDRGKAAIQPNSAHVSFVEIDKLTKGRKDEDNCVVGMYIMRNLLWNWKDDEASQLLQDLLPTLRATPGARILVTDGVSPPSNEFPPHVEIAFRRRDVTTMTMHNQKQRDQDEWLRLFTKLDPSVKVKTTFKKSSHVLKGLWEISSETC